MEERESCGEGATYHCGCSKHKYDRGTGNKNIYRIDSSLGDSQNISAKTSRAQDFFLSLLIILSPPTQPPWHHHTLSPSCRSPHPPPHSLSILPQPLPTTNTTKHQRHHHSLFILPQPRRSPAQQSKPEAPTLDCRN